MKTNMETLNEILKSEGLKYLVYYFDGNIISTMYNNDKMIFFSSAYPSMTLMDFDLQGIDFPKLCKEHIEVGQEFKDAKLYKIDNIDHLIKLLEEEKRDSVAQFFKDYKLTLEGFIK